ncbi:MAG: RdgB/HAM1 family non-canonical purine NTP pyrophosphatase [Victivallaceae bacterium]|jgi:XTP/dITP diphosphohydrolase|nr:RdgB/HAM1 family non-canonical purine NTP pyrophosphatase [Victivallaceae bacterium]MDD3703321.1 RdgB/HAM1 family non-canonical purine NTP pyrophosphatase [Victivallaceae bacterium]MDD4317196.1 RdgB/HAM1 family non-canonical purine NTP pyrophosphatase [Victivallaceae bacterium]MDD5664152.1 RdgB/HAM1 family non-canonical purine NTP pyrophosphatase [Victivallaceae bacterium]NLK83440.1 RdgB/HAM1 family non-canonical purine NTP pyrophosphatase [Lentisphaerota bacterium]
MFKVVAATANPHKLVEFRKLLHDQNAEIVGLDSYPEMPPIEENGKSFLENAGIKALAAHQYCGVPAFGDDSGLEIEALNGAPGIYSARYADTPEGRINRVLTELKGQTNRSAKFVCIIAIAANGEVIEAFKGEVKGKIIDTPRGTNGFGYDPIFVPEGYEQTFAEMPEELKNKISHRARACQAAIEFIEDEMSILDDDF